MKVPDGLTRAWWILIGLTALGATAWSVFAVLVTRFPADHPPWWVLVLSVICFLIGMVSLFGIAGYAGVEIPYERRRRRKRAQWKSDSAGQ